MSRMKRGRSNAIRVFVLVFTLVLCAGILQSQAVTLQQPTTPTLQQPVTPTPPIPNITSWGPQGKVAAGDRIWFNGTGLNPSTFIATLGERGFPAYYQLYASPTSTSTRIEVVTTMNMLTGPTAGLPLRVMNSGGTAKLLYAGYHVIDRNAHFTGTSQYQEVQKGGNIFTQGTVQITLNNLDFADSGTGTYGEQVQLIEQRTVVQSCQIVGKLVNGIRNIVYYEWKNNITQARPISWKRLAGTSDQIILSGIGVTTSDSCLMNTTATLSSGGLATEFVYYCYGSGAVKPYIDSSDACHLASRFPGPLLAMAGDQWAGIIHPVTPPPLQPRQPAYVIFTLLRRD